MKGKVLIFSILLLTAKVCAQPLDINIGTFFQPGISYRMITYQNQEMQEAFRLLHENDKLDIGWEGGITAQVFLNDFIHIEPGISISKKGYQSVLSTDDLIFSEEPEDPQLVDLKKSTSNHEFYYVSVPVRVGATVYRDRTFAVGARAGLSLDYHFRSTIRYEKIYHDRVENSVVHPENTEFRKLNLSGSLSLFCSYKLSDNYDIALEPYCSVSILPVVQGTDLSMRFILGGLRASLHYKF